MGGCTDRITERKSSSQDANAERDERRDPAVDERVGWNRIAFAISLLIIAVALVTLFRLLRDVELDKVVEALQATSPHTVMVAAILVAAGYVTLTFYDFFALRTIGQTHVPYRIAALASFTSYTIGHNLGATVFTGGVVRLRIYSPWGLGIVDIAKIAFVTGLTFWLGNAFILGLSMAYAPDAASAVNQLPPWLNRTIALAGLAAIVGYLLWLVPASRAIGYGDWQITLPNASSPSSRSESGSRISRSARWPCMCCCRASLRSISPLCSSPSCWRPCSDFSAMRPAAWASSTPPCW